MIPSQTLADYLKAGFALIPIAPGSKGPNTKGWSQRENCITSAADLGRITANVGLAHAYSGTCALDFDDLEQSRQWFANHGIDIDALLAAPDSVRISSGRPNRAKLFYRLPEGVKPLLTIKNKAFELRCGNAEGTTVQDVLPPSIHPDTGQPYRWEYGDEMIGDWRYLPTLPSAVLDLWVRALAGKNQPAEAKGERSALDAEPRLGLSLSEVVDLLRPINPDIGYEYWCKVLMAVHHETGGSQAAFEIVDEWSAKGTKYEDNVDTHWRSFKTDKSNIAGALWLRKFSAQCEAEQTNNNSSSVVAPIDWSHLAPLVVPARRWREHHWLPEGKPFLLAGAGGVGKSNVVQAWGACQALGRSYLDRVDEPCVVLAWMGEDDKEEIWRRQVAVASWLDVELSAFAGKLILMPYDGEIIDLAVLDRQRLRATKRLDELRQQIGDYKAGLVFFDNVARVFGGDENNRHQVTSFVAMLQHACSVNNATLGLLSHPAKATDSEYSGSTAWEGAVRTRLYLGRHLPGEKQSDDDAGDESVRYLARRKANYSSQDWRCIRYVNGVMVPDAPPSDVLTGVSELDAQDLVLSAVRTLASMDEYGNTSTSSPNYLPRLAKKYRLLGGLSDRQFTVAMVELQKSNRISKQVVGRYSNRSKREGLAEVKP